MNHRLLLALLAPIFLMCCSSEDGAVPAATDTCAAVCGHLRTSCPDKADTLDTCLAECEDKNKASSVLGCDDTFKSFLTCCSAAELTTEFCDTETIVSFGDCDDPGLCEKTGLELEECGV